jgi:hypothetical protein
MRVALFEGMNPYTRLASAVGDPSAHGLAARLMAWHDEMVFHERLLARWKTDVCDESCPHTEAQELWSEALRVFGGRAHDLTFLATRADAAGIG